MFFLILSGFIWSCCFHKSWFRASTFIAVTCSQQAHPLLAQSTHILQQPIHPFSQDVQENIQAIWSFLFVFKLLDVITSEQLRHFIITHSCIYVLFFKVMFAISVFLCFWRCVGEQMLSFFSESQASFFIF